MVKINNLKKLELFQLVELRDAVQMCVNNLRATFSWTPTEKFNKFNALLSNINQLIENKIENEYLE